MISERAWCACRVLACGLDESKTKTLFSAFWLLSLSLPPPPPPLLSSPATPRLAAIRARRRQPLSPRTVRRAAMSESW